MNEPRPLSLQPGDADDLAERLRELLPGLRLLDRDLELDGAPTADLVGEAGGRLVLVLLADGEGDEPVLATLDALAAARRDGALLARHLGLPDGERTPLVLLLAERFGERLRGRLREIPADRLWLLERRGVRTAGRDARPFVRIQGGAPGPPGEPPPPAPAAARFLAALPPDLARLGGELVERLSRMDSELEVELGPDPGPGGGNGGGNGGGDGGEGARGGLAWSFRGRPLCTVLERGGRLEGRLAGSSVPHAIQSPGAIDAFLEWVLSCHLELLDGEHEGEVDGGGGRLGEVELVPPAREPLLTREELEAFRD